MPKEAFELALKIGNLLERASVITPDGPGLDINVDCGRLATADYYGYSKPDIPVWAIKTEGFTRH